MNLQPPPSLRSVCVFCGSSFGVGDIYRDAARDLGQLLGEGGIRLVYGGGRVGLMGIVADAAIAAGGEVVGVIPGFLHDLEVGHQGVAELVIVGSMHERKARMFELSDAFAVLPGGLGTLDETVEILTWKQLRRHDKPVVMVDVEGYWQPFLALVEHVVEHGFARPENRNLFTVADGPEDLFRAIAEHPATVGDVRRKWG